VKKLFENKYVDF